MAQGPHPWPPRGAFWPPPTPPKHSQCGPVEGAGFVPTQPKPTGAPVAACRPCKGALHHLWAMGAGAGAAAHPQPMAGGAGCRWGSFLEVSGKFPARRLWPQLHRNGARQHTQAPPLPLAPCTFLWAIFPPGLVGAARHGPLWGFGVQPPAALAVSWKFPRTPPKTLAGPAAP